MSTALPSLERRRARLHEINRSIRAHQGRAAVMLYQVGAWMIEVEEARLWEADEHPSFDAWLSDALDLSRTVAYKAMRVARHFNREMVERYGIEKLNAGLRYLELTHAEEKAGDLIAADLRLRGPEGRYVSVPFHEASANQVKAAAQLLVREKARGRGVPEQTRAWASRVGEALTASTGHAAPLALKQGRGGKLSVRFAEVPVEDLAAFARALLAAVGETEPG